MKCSICGEEKTSTRDRPTESGDSGKAKTQAICDACFTKQLGDTDEGGEG